MSYHQILESQVYSNYSELEEKIELLPTTKEKGDAFEDFIYLYFLLHKQKYQIDEVFKITDIPRPLLKKYKLEKRDSGVDGLVVRDDGLVCGYQVKFRSGRERPSYAELAKFWVESKYTDYRYTIANCNGITKLAQKQTNHIELLVNEFDSLSVDFFEQLYALATNRDVVRKRYTPHDFQKEIIRDVVNGFKNSTRGKYIAACGTGKTLTSLWIMEELESSDVLFMAPNLSLIKQTIEEYAKQAKDSFSYLCVCSDSTVDSEVSDFGDIAISDMDFPVTTDVSQVSKFLSKDTPRRRIIFSTYQSLEVLAEAIKSSSFTHFDLAIYDEAHRTAGATNSEVFNLGLSDKHVPCKLRLFMTATERMLMPRLKNLAKEKERTVFSMDDVEVYGETFHRLNFGTAIELGIISDYRVVVAAIREQEVFHWIKNNTEIKDDDSGFQAFAEVLFSQILYTKSVKNYGISKSITFHSSINNSKNFTAGIFKNYDLRTMLKVFDPQLPVDDVYINHIDGSYSAGTRKEILNEFKDSRHGILSNSRCLTEGVDVPEIDSIYFVDPKHSLIDIAQACGRALRKPANEENKVAYIILPILIPEDIEEGELFNSDKFDYIFNVIQSLRDQDNRMVQWIDVLNENISRGIYEPTPWSPIDIQLPDSFDIEKFEQSLLTRIATVNGEPTEKRYRLPKSYGRNERNSNYKRVFKPIADYSIQSLQKSLVDPTMKYFESANQHKHMSEIKFSHNNVSHTERMGLLLRNEHRQYVLTELGKQYHREEVTFGELFKRQILRHYSITKSGTLFPYRAMLQFLIAIKEINMIHFVYPISMATWDSQEHSIRDTIEAMAFINSEYPNPELLNETNQKKLLQQFNDLWEVDHSYENVWTNRTTMYNQFTYFRNHLSTFDNLVIVDPARKTIKLSDGCEEELLNLLMADAEIEKLRDKKSLHNYFTKFLEFMLISL